MTPGKHNVSSETLHRLAERQSERILRDSGAASRFWAKVQIGDVGECWPWAASVGGSGYGQFAWAARYGRTRPAAAHRVAWELTHGRALTTAEYVCHSCDTPLCVNPSHLFVGTQFDNMRDASRKGRLAKRDTTVAL